MIDVYDHNCRLCPLSSSGNNWVCLPGIGDRKARAIVVGEAPGANEDSKGEPFVGMSGSYLNAALAKSGVHRSELFITNAVKCRPPGNRTPTNFEIETCFTYLDEEVAAIDPIVIMVLGNIPLWSVLREKGITKKAGIWHRIEGPYEDILVIPNYHPAYVARFPDKLDFFEEVVDDFVKVWKYGLNHSLEDTWRYAKP